MDVPLPTRFGTFMAHLFRSAIDGKEHMALTIGLPGPSIDGPRTALEDPVTVRVHSECLTGDVFGSLRCDCGEQLHHAMRTAAANNVFHIRYCGGDLGQGADHHIVALAFGPTNSAS